MVEVNHIHHLSTVQLLDGETLILDTSQLPCHRTKNTDNTFNVKLASKVSKTN